MKSSADATDADMSGFAHLMIVVQVANLARLDGGERCKRHGGAESLGGHREIGTERRNVRASRQPAHETMEPIGGTAALPSSMPKFVSVDGAARKTRADHICEI